MKKYINRKDFLNIDERDVLFITNPGRMGDEDGITFVVKKGNNYNIYRVDGWMYPDKNDKERITLRDAIRQFPKWYEALENCNNEKYHGKYKYLYMGFGNGLCIDNSIYDEYKPYLDEEVNKYLDACSEDKEAFQYAAIFNTWDEALIKMIDDKNDK